MSKTPKPTEVDAIKRLFEAISTTNDVALAVVIGTYIDFLVTRLLELHFPLTSSTAEKLLKPGGAVGEAMAKADLAYCLGFIQKSIYNEAKTIFEIRNYTGTSRAGSSSGTSRRPVSRPCIGS